LKIKTIGNGQQMDNTTPNQLIEHSFWEPTNDTKQILSIWRVHAENKRKLFTWILIQNKILMVDNLELRGCLHHHACGPLKIGYHNCLACPFAQVVWSLVTSWEHFDTIDVAQHSNFNTLADRWEQSLSLIPNDRK
jgi:hypothetical protein